VGHASDLKGGDRWLYRLFEVFPGALSWGTILGMVFFSWVYPIAVAIFIIAFDVYWLVKTAYLSLHLRASWRRMIHYMEIDWEERLVHLKWNHVWQLVILPFYNEPYEVVTEACQSLKDSKWPKERMIVVLATEERAGQEAQNIAERVRQSYANVFGHFLVTKHSQNMKGELMGKGANIAWAAKETKKEIIDAFRIPYENIVVSSFDIDTQAYPQYFLCLTYHFLTAEHPYQSSYQPIPLYNNNIWDAPVLSRVVAVSGTYWQMMQQVRPERLTTFSSHSMSFKALVKVGFWQANVVSEDSRIFWNALLAFNGDYYVVPLFYPVSMDANVAPTFFKTVRNIYRQQRRWTWGVENIPYILFGFFKNRAISFQKRIYYLATQLEGFWSLATNPILIFALGWLPLFLGGDEFNVTLISYNLPRITRTLMTIAMLGLIGSAFMSVALFPPRPKNRHRFSWAFMMLQWMLVPFTVTVFGAIPGLDAQARLMFGKYMGFWVTPKEGKRAGNLFQERVSVNSQAEKKIQKL